MTQADGIQTKHGGWLVLSVMLATIMQILDATVANVALPHMQSSLSASADTIVWALTSYVIGTAIVMPTVGWLTGQWGQKNVLLFAVGGFVVASALCGIAQTLPEMILFRTLQGALGASLVPVSLSIMLDSLPDEKRAPTIAIWGAGLMVGPLAGPIIGGWLTENLNWRWVFLLNVPIGIPAFIGCWATIPALPRRQHRFDRFGYAVLALGLISLQLMLDRGERLEWFDSPEVLLEGAVALCSLAVYLIHTLTADRPLYPRPIFQDANFIVASTLIFTVGLTLFASMALMPPMLQTLFGYPVTFTGLVLAPRGAGTMLSMILLGKISHRLDPRLCTGLGLLIVAWSSYETAHFTLDVSWDYFAMTGFVQGIGFGLVSLSINSLAFSTLSSDYRSDATSFYSLARNVGSSLGISVVTALLSRNLQISHADLVSAIPSYSLPGVDPQMALVMLDAEINRQAMLIAYLDDFYLLAFLAVAVVPLLLLVRRPSTAPDPDAAHLATE